MKGAVETIFVTDAGELARTFSELCRGATRIDLAVAWASPGPALDQLCAAIGRKAEVRAVIGRDIHGTHPDVYRRLIEKNRLCVRWPRPSRAGTFHPKVYLFWQDDAVTALLGSANLTHGAFTVNEEAMALIRGDAEVVRGLLSWFEQLWNVSSTISDEELEEYADRFSEVEEAADEEDDSKEDEEEIRLDIAEAASLQSSLLIGSWPQYVAALERADVLWRKYKVPVFGEESWLAAFEEVSPLAQRPIERLRRDQRLALFGNNHNQAAYPNCAHFGRMIGAGQARHYLEGDDDDSKQVQRRVSKALSMLGAPGEPRPTIERAAQAYKLIWDVGGLGKAVTTRYLLMRRPDCFVSVNSASVEGLARLFKVSEGRLDRWEGYRELLTQLWQAPWMNAPRPAPGRDERVWLARAALIDVFVYQPKQWDHPDLDELA